MLTFHYEHYPFWTALTVLLFVDHTAVEGEELITKFWQEQQAMAVQLVATVWPGPRQQCLSQPLYKCIPVQYDDRHTNNATLDHRSIENLLKGSFTCSCQ